MACNDPDFETKAADIIGLYLESPQHAVKSGNIKKPADYRDLHQTLGTCFVLDPNGGKQMHLSYVSPGAADIMSCPMQHLPAEAPVNECAGCNMANFAKTDRRGCSSIPFSATNENVNAKKWGRGSGVATSFLPTVSSPCDDEIILKKHKGDGMNVISADRR